jgi:hypothetical protein
MLAWTVSMVVELCGINGCMQQHVLELLQLDVPQSLARSGATNYR